MDISNRKALLLNITKKSSNLERATTREIVRQVREPFGGNNDAAVEELTKLRDAFQAGTPMTYTKEQHKLLASYQDLFDNWETFAEYVNKPMQELGDWVAEKTIVPVVKGVMEMAEGGKREGVNVPSRPDRDAAAKLIQNPKESSGFDDLKYFKQTYSALQNNNFHKISSSDIVRQDISDAFEKELDKSFDIIHVKFAEKYNTNLDIDTYNKFYELAVAHHILTQEGQLKDAAIIDQFVLKNGDLWGLTKKAGLGDWLSDAWEGTKNVVSEGLSYVGNAIKENPLVLGLAAGLKKGWKGLKYLVSKLPFVGIIFSLPFAIKNLIESYHNGKRILWEADLPKFGFNRALCITPAGGMIGGHVSSTFRSAIKKFRLDPDGLKELLTVFRTIGAFWIDVLLAITNGLMAILDAIAIAGLFVPVVGWVASIGAMGGSFLLAIGIGALEISAEYFKDEHWEKQEKHLLSEAHDAVREILANGTPIEEDNFIINNAPQGVSSISINPDVVETSELAEIVETSEDNRPDNSRYLTGLPAVA